jgi:hypothetical protein
MRRMSSSNIANAALITFGVVFATGLLFSNAIIHFATKDSVSFVVEHRERVASRSSDGNSTSRYMIWAKMPGGDVEVFQNTDSFLSFKFNSADLYGRMQPGRNCDATVNGFRFPLMSWNRNILDVTCR